ncbi:glycoside hydrolase family 73 protein [Companilactobacillus hulinensis]|uniref:glycoside hydrolase family 73 protein n=1 Tax=Companilactobacillus hulinensis TaxID=2486007 RepID=UPI000F77F682|nr:glycoside hydrolase family 73 protein [Companilactobacillus hulinensis]
MNKKVLLTSATILGIVAMSSTTMASAASNSGIIAGPEVDKSDPTVASFSELNTNLNPNSSEKAIVQATNNYASPAEQQAFLSKAVPIAQQVAKKYNIYASVMLAQAINESGWGKSGLSTATNNLFGIKGSYNGATYTVSTREWSSSKGYYYIYSNFSKYPSYYESFDDNGNKLRNGVAWNHSYYSGTWKENTSSYKDATAWLQGRYATEPNYSAILNNTIQNYNLTQYDISTNANSNHNDSNNKSPETNGGSTDEVQQTGTVRVNYAPYANIYDNNGKLVRNRALSNHSNWYFNKTKTDSNGVVWYHVATTEWVSANKVNLIK